MRVHFIAIGGSIMHSLAIALHMKGDVVSGSDDELFEPARSNLARYGLLPDTEGWDTERITGNIDAVILGMHAKADNPELTKAIREGVRIFSFPEFLYEHAKNKTRVVIGGSHGKTTITAMIMHVMKLLEMPFDYMVGSQIRGFEVMVGLSDEAPVMVFEGDEYLTSALDKRPKFHLYKPNVAVISGIEWDHMNVFPCRDNYFEQFRIFTNQIEENGTLIYCHDDPMVRILAEQATNKVKMIPYSVPEFAISNDRLMLVCENKKYPLSVFGKHNLLNLNAAMLVCKELGIDKPTFCKAIASFQGAAKRLELIKEEKSHTVFKDFAHAPSKVKATIEAVKSRYPGKKLTAILELHTYSSLNKSFLPEYGGSMEMADIAVVFFDPHALKLKRLPDLKKEDIQTAFNKPGILVFNDIKMLSKFLYGTSPDGVYLFMSSGNFGGLDLMNL